MSQLVFNLKSFSRSINNIIGRRRCVLITQASQKAYANGSSREKPPWTSDRVTGYYRPETIAKYFVPYIVTTSKSEVKTRGGEELWWMPDPETGFYRPVAFGKEPDAVDLKSMHENKKTL